MKKFMKYVPEFFWIISMIIHNIVEAFVLTYETEWRRERRMIFCAFCRKRAEEYLASAEQFNNQNDQTNCFFVLEDAQKMANWLKKAGSISDYLSIMNKVLMIKIDIISPQKLSEWMKTQKEYYRLLHWTA